MQIRLAAVALGATLAFFPAAAAQDAKEAAAPGMDDMMAMMEKMGAVTENHRLLETFAGEWTTVAKMTMDPSAPPTESPGTASAKMIFDGRFCQMTHHGEMMGKPFQGIGTTGFDNATGKFVSTWIDSMSTGIMTAEGTYDAAKKTFTFTGTMPDPMTRGTTKFRYTYNASNRDRLVFEWFETREGKETKSMELTYTRKKGA